MNGEDGVTSAPAQLEWKFSQVFGERTAGEEVQEGIVGFSFFLIRFMYGVYVETRAWLSHFDLFLMG